MQKDVIYIDVDDDITAIIGKLKASKHEIVALVPPKRVGVLQSAVNLRLMQRAADQRKKRLVLVTNNQALMGLAAAASIPVAKTLQSKPEIPEIAALEVDDGNDVIDGSELPVGMHMAAAKDDTPATTEALGAAAVAETPPAKSIDAQRKSALAAAKAKKKPKVPNFDTFRKKLVFIIIGVLLLIGFLVWAIVFAPRARIELSTRATESAVNQPITLGSNMQTASDKNTLQSVVKTLEKPISLEFNATGKKDVGEKARGSVSFSTRDTEALGTQIPAGTVLKTSSGASYTTDSAVTINYSNRTGVRVNITASENGSKYNGATGSMDGAPSGIRASIADSTGGGTDKTITVVTSGDIEAAKQKASDSLDLSAAKRELTSQFADGKQAVLEESFNTDVSSLASSVGPDAEAASGKATITGKAVHSMQAIDNSVLDKYLTEVLESQIDNPGEQRVYESGAKSVAFSQVKKVEGGISATLTTNGKIGPNIEEEQVREKAKGKRIGEIKTEMEAIQGVESADIRLSPFWVGTVPDDDKKITVEFKLNE